MIRVVVCGTESAAGVTEVLAGGALTVVVEAGIARAVDPAAAAAPYIEAALAA